MLHVMLVPIAGPVFAHALGDVALNGRGEASSGAPWIVLALALSVAAYVVGLARLWRASGRGRGIRGRQALAFAGGCAMLAVALLGPLHAWSERAFAAHMLQHELLMLVAAPLLVAGRPLAAWSWVVPSRTPALARALRVTPLAASFRALTRPLGATLAQLVLLFVLHVPRLFDYAATHPLAHALQHVGFLAGALAFWWAMRCTRADGAPGVALACLFITMLATGALGALLTFGAVPWYGIYGNDLPWGNALDDQQLGGLVMWIPGGCAYLAAALLRARDLLARGAPDGVSAAAAARPAIVPPRLSTGRAPATR